MRQYLKGRTERDYAIMTGRAQRVCVSGRERERERDGKCDK